MTLAATDFKLIYFGSVLGYLAAGIIIVLRKNKPKDLGLLYKGPAGRLAMDFK